MQKPPTDVSEPVVVLLFAHKPRLDRHEEISLIQCCRILKQHPIRLVCPNGLDISEYRRIEPTIEVDFIPSHWMADIRAYNRLKILPFLYRRYSQYEFMLTYELDAFVFRDELLSWCAEGWDYIGAPWFKGYREATVDAPPHGVGNSGFSLRRTRAMLRVLRTLRSQMRFVTALRIRNNFLGPFNDHPVNEDIFWCELVAPNFPEFRIAPFEAARRFSFEVNPSRLYEECGRSLPFGCHKWMIHEPDFWKAHIESCP